LQTSALKSMNEIPLNTHSFYVTALETEVATIGLLSFWISIFVSLINMLFLRFCWWKLYNKCYEAFCDSNAYVIKRLLVGYGNICTRSGAPDVAQYYNAQKPRDWISSLDTQNGDRSPRFEVKNWWFYIFTCELQIAD